MTPPTKGSATISTDGTYTYTPNSTFEGLDSIGFVACSGGECGYTASATCTGSVCSPGTLYIGVAQGTTTTSKEATDSGVSQNVTNLTAGVSWNGKPANDAQFQKQIHILSNIYAPNQTSGATGSDNQSPITVNSETGEVSVAPRATPGTYTIKTLMCLSMKSQSSMDLIKKMIPISSAFSDSSVAVNLYGPTPCVNQITYIMVDSTPIAQDDAFSTWVNMNLRDSVAKNDVYPVGAIFSLINDVHFGKLRFLKNGEFRYNPKARFRGVDTFTYSLCEPAPRSSICSIATVSLNVGTVKLTQKALLLSASKTEAQSNGPIVLHVKGGSTHSKPVFTVLPSKGANCRITGSASTRLLRIFGTTGMNCTVTASKSGNKVYDSIVSNAVTVTLK